MPDIVHLPALWGTPALVSRRLALTLEWHARPRVLVGAISQTGCQVPPGARRVGDVSGMPMIRAELGQFESTVSDFRVRHPGADAHLVPAPPRVHREVEAVRADPVRREPHRRREHRDRGRERRVIGPVPRKPVRRDAPGPPAVVGDERVLEPAATERHAATRYAAAPRERTVIRVRTTGGPLDRAGVDGRPDADDAAIALSRRLA